MGKIKIITTPMIISDFYNSYIPNFLNTYPGINIEFYETDGANVFKQLQKDTNSLGISTIITNPEYHLLDAYEDVSNSLSILLIFLFIYWGDTPSCWAVLLKEAFFTTNDKIFKSLKVILNQLLISSK